MRDSGLERTLERIAAALELIAARLHSPHQAPSAAESCLQARKRAGWTQQELADHCGVSQASVSRFECGVHTPRWLLPDLERALGVKLE